MLSPQKLFALIFVTFFVLTWGRLNAQSERQAIGIVIDAGDPVLTRMGQELAQLVETNKVAIQVKPTMGPVANVQRMLSRENAGLGIVPSDILRYVERANEPQLKQAVKRLRFVMALGTKDVHLLARKEIRRFEELEGKRVIVGKNNTGIWVTSNNLLHLMGVTPAEEIQLPPLEAIAAVLKNEADAAFVIDTAPHPLIANIATLHSEPRTEGLAQQVHLLPLNDPKMLAVYHKAIVRYPGFADAVETIAIRPTMVSYDFSSRASRYFRNRCMAFRKIGTTVRSRLAELQASGHPRWQQTSWMLDAGAWQKDRCF